MKIVRNAITTMVVTGLATLSYAKPPAQVAAQTLSALSPSLAMMAIAQQDEQPKDKPKTQQDEQTKDKPSSKAADAGKQQEKPAKQPATDTGKQVKPAMQPAPDKARSTGDRDQKQNLAKQDQKQDTGHATTGRRIPDQDFKAHFGQEHKFSVRTVVTTTTIVPNQTRFVYTGYTFVFADPWPAGWAMDDDVYIDFIDGEYYILDLSHPGVQVALTIVG